MYIETGSYGQMLVYIVTLNIDVFASRLTTKKPCPLFEPQLCFFTRPDREWL